MKNSKWIEKRLTDLDAQDILAPGEVVIDIRLIHFR